MHIGQFKYMGENNLVAKYYEKMGRDGRTLQIKENGKLHTFMTFSICNDFTPYANKGIWEYLPHNPEGFICFVEKVVSMQWTKELRKQVEAVILERYPQVEGAVWFRPGLNNERKVVYRRKHETSL